MKIDTQAFPQAPRVHSSVERGGRRKMAGRERREEGGDTCAGDVVEAGVEVVASRWWRRAAGVEVVA